MTLKHPVPHRDNLLIMNIKLLILFAYALSLTAVQSQQCFAGSLYKCIKSDGSEFYTDNYVDQMCKKVVDDSRNITVVGHHPTVGSQNTNSSNITENFPNIVASDANKIILPQRGLTRFFRQLKKLERGEVRQLSIFHFGDSHVRSDSFASTVASKFQARLSLLGGEFCYSPPAKKTTVSRWKQKKINSKKSLHAQQGLTSDNVLKITEADSPPQECRPITQSITPAASRGIIYNSYANSGKTFTWYSKQAFLTSKLKSYNPDLIIITLGTNDAFAKLTEQKYISDISDLLEVIKSACPESSILFTTPPDCYFRDGQHNDYIPLVRKAMMEYASQHGIMVWDFNSVMGGNGSINKWLELGLAKNDRIHLTPRGYALKGSMLADSLLNKYDQMVRH